ncbi:hypothetical protein M408DRAFT_330993 [Serendipita vermifera MAFF 305830]|uniref:Transcription factor CBF/NF-Y/archaeal histone domain-containing protein n=1 Tax=Serendipita vermifera MAFF 305830 TaxID=933852 RepID=A0A0C3B0R7_SERVB|nr:hypothetical protein M408DRAFT_330993 [Serendipita vermifera MAFF 305830]
MDDTEAGASNADNTQVSGNDRVPGKSLFPVARVQKILKADTELAGIAKDAVFLVSIATERFIARVSEAAKSQAGREKRTTVQRKDILTVTRREAEYYFLGDILGEAPSAKPSLWGSKSTKEKPADTTGGDGQAKGTDAPLLRAFGMAEKGKEGEDEDEGEGSREDDGAQSEGVSLPPSSRPSTPLSLGDDEEYEYTEPVDDEMEEDR